MRTWWAIEVCLVAFVRNILKHHPTLVCRFRGCLESIWQRSSTYLARNWRVNTKAAPIAQSLDFTPCEFFLFCSERLHRKFITPWIMRWNQLTNPGLNFNLLFCPISLLLFVGVVQPCMQYFSSHPRIFFWGSSLLCQFKIDRFS